MATAVQISLICRLAGDSTKNPGAAQNGGYFAYPG
jgi:hypothetical protein